MRVSYDFQKLSSTESGIKCRDDDEKFNHSVISFFPNVNDSSGMVSLLHYHLHLKGGSPFILTEIMYRKKRGVKLFSTIYGLKFMARTTER